VYLYVNYGTNCLENLELIRDIIQMVSIIFMKKTGNLENCELSTRGLHGFSVYDGKWTQYNHGVIKARFDGIYRPDPMDPDEQPFYPDLEPPPK